MTTSLARIFVQNKFCIQCVDTIESRMMEVQHISNVIVYPQDALVVFNFRKANQVSEVLNTLTSLGYPPLGDVIDTPTCQTPLCECAA